MPTGIAIVGKVDDEAKAAVQTLAEMVQEATNDACTIDLLQAAYRAVASPFDVNDNILLVYFFHGGKLIDQEMEDRIGAEFTALYPDWKAMFVPAVLPNWWANGQQV